MRRRGSFIALAMLAQACGGQAASQGGVADGSSETGTEDASTGADVTAPVMDAMGAADVRATDAPAGTDGPSADAAPEATTLGESGPPLFTPASLGSKLAFWFDPTSLRQTTGGTIVRWVDLSTNANDATQGTTANQPAYTASCINGLPCATFGGPIVFLQIADAPTMQWGTGDLLVLAVVRGRAQSAAEAMLYQKTAAYPYDGASLYLNADKPSTTTLAAAQVSGQVYVVSAPPPATFDDGSVHLLGVHRTGTALEVRVDGVVNNSIVNASVGSSNVSVAGTDAIIGQNGYAATANHQQFHGDIAEMVGVGAAVTQTELTDLETYLKTRYAIP